MWSMEPPVIAAIITSSVTLTSVVVAVIALTLQINKDRTERKAAVTAREEADTEKADAIAKAEKERAEALERADKERAEALERADKIRAEDAHRRERAKAYSDFLEAQSARADAFNHYSYVRKLLTHEPFAKDSPKEVERLAKVNRLIDAASAEIDRTRSEAWGPMATMRLIGSEKVIGAANDYDEALAASNPRRTRMEPKHLDFALKRDLIAAFVAAAREDLGRPPLRGYVLTSTDEESEEREEVEELLEASVAPEEASVAGNSEAP